MMVALYQDTVRLFVARHVLDEVERDLPDYAASVRVDPELAVTQWRQRYKPFIRVVDVPAPWGEGSPYVQAVFAQHAVDAPTPRLATALADSYVLAEDPDLTDHGFGSRKSLPLRRQTMAEAHRH